MTAISGFSVAGIRLAVRGSLSAAELGLEERLKEFAVAPGAGRAEVTVDWREGDAGEPVRGEVAFDPGELWKMYRSPGGGFTARLDYSSGRGEVNGQALIEANPAWDTIRLTERRGGPGWRSLLALGAGELIVRNRILFAPGLIFHACGVDDRGHGLLLAGHAGAGKSTQARLWAAARGPIVLSDDRVAVRLDANTPSICGTPWGGDAAIATNRRARLAAILLLGKAAENSLRRLAREVAVAELAVRAFLPHWDTLLLEQALRSVERLVTEVPVYTLDCRPQADVSPLVRSIL